jgi:hypothetical protein
MLQLIIKCIDPVLLLLNFSEDNAECIAEHAHLISHIICLIRILVFSGTGFHEMLRQKSS